MRCCPSSAQGAWRGMRCCVRPAARWPRPLPPSPPWREGASRSPAWFSVSTPGRCAGLCLPPSTPLARMSALSLTRPGPPWARRCGRRWAGWGRPLGRRLPCRGGRARETVRCAYGSCQRPRRGVGACGGDRWRCRLRAGSRAGWRRWLRPVCVVDALTLRVGAGSQSGKAGAARVVGRMGAMRARVAVPTGTIAIAVDDVVTTGATIREMERALGRLDGVAALCRPRLIS